ncbi:hypothetical protein BJV78DRAFT_1235269 [Lactifluus subvellereus]|nr:hypothetical protein BJV78DRAFT_1235269 [Lactifluus subvellereus]
MIAVLLLSPLITSIVSHPFPPESSVSSLSPTSHVTLSQIPVVDAVARLQARGRTQRVIYTLSALADNAMHAIPLSRMSPCAYHGAHQRAWLIGPVGRTTAYAISTARSMCIAQSLISVFCMNAAWMPDGTARTSSSALPTGIGLSVLNSVTVTACGSYTLDGA